MAVEGAAAASATDEEGRALIASVCLAGTDTRRVKRALFGLFQGAVGAAEQKVQPPGQDPDHAALHPNGADAALGVLASGRIQMRKVDGRKTLSQPLKEMPMDLAV